MRIFFSFALGLPIVAFAAPYPLCPDSWENYSESILEVAKNKGASDKKVKLGFDGASELLGQHLGSASETMTPKTSKGNLSKRFELELPSASKMGLGSPSSIGYWNDAKESLSALAPNEQKEILLKSFPGLLERPLQSQKLNGSQFDEQLKLVKVQAQIAVLQKTVDPITLKAYVGEEALGLADSKLLKLHSDTSLRALALQTGIFASANGRKKSSDVLMVGAGEPGKAGGLGNVPKPVPVAFGKLDGGGACVRPAFRNDWMLEPSTNKIGRVWDPEGFRDVGLLVWRTNDGHGRVGSPSICSFVRVGGVYAVTAAHCVIDSGGGAPVRPRNFRLPGVEAVALLPRYETPEANPLDCFEKANACGFHVSRVQSPALLPDNVGWPSVSKWPEPDVALLSLPFPATVPVATTGVATGEPASERLTMAGYGLNEAVGSFKWGSLLVGWQQRPPHLDSTGLVWSVDVKNGAAGGCGGDSGGAVYDGDIAGLPKEVRKLAGVISSGEFSRTGGSDVARCATARSGRAARLDRLLPWLCKMSTNQILGCPGNEVKAAL